MGSTQIPQAAELMSSFARRTGISGGSPPHRYLWTDAHAVCNFLTLHAYQGDTQWLALAVALVDQVHEVLGRHRADDVRSGWISGLSEAEGRKHPTIGGLRIGKRRPERSRNAPVDEQGEWEQDGQYYHYLTKWIHALGRMGAVTGDARYRRWAQELVVASYQGFRAASGPARLHWKMSIDLSYPLVVASGQHDPLDGLITSLVVLEYSEDPGVAELRAVSDALGVLCRTQAWFTDDPLGLGGLLFDAARIVQLTSEIGRETGLPLLEPILDAAHRGIESFVMSGALQRPAAQRLAFRELGLSIGLQALDQLAGRALRPSVMRRLDQLRAFSGLQKSIEQVWLRPDLQQLRNWREHLDINSVMLATSLEPAMYLEI
ncbi:MAG: hypothetical protein R3E82_15960 [Pseudomonadales bacterium]|nr:hypothetical protein [Pseudomonadales bacterium]